VPIYEYRCATCGVIFERMTRFSDTMTSTCPNGHDDTQRVFSPPGIVFRGSGFYVTDNRPDGKSNGSGD
jgi:putative FmdB family regulatory protein